MSVTSYSVREAAFWSRVLIDWIVKGIEFGGWIERKLRSALLIALSAEYIFVAFVEKE